jgi:hypothetical protein
VILDAQLGVRVPDQQGHLDGLRVVSLHVPGESGIDAGIGAADSRPIAKNAAAVRVTTRRQR